MPTPIEVVQGIYAAFQRGDVDAILSTLADDVAWESWTDNSAQGVGVPWLTGGVGRAAVADFFRVLGEMTIHEVQVLDFLASPHQVAVEFVIDVTTRTGARYRDEELHLWTVNAAGLVTRMRHYADTAKHIKAAGLSA